MVFFSFPKFTVSWACSCKRAFTAYYSSGRGSFWIVSQPAIVTDTFFAFQECLLVFVKKVRNLGRLKTKCLCVKLWRVMRTFFISCFESPWRLSYFLSTLIDLEIPILPKGQRLVINIRNTWGDRHYVGLNGIEVFTDCGKPAEIAEVSM